MAHQDDGIEHLDWEQEITCSGEGCAHEGVALVKFRPHEECQQHRRWYVACQCHLDVAREHGSRCYVCNLHLAMTGVVYL